MQEVLVGLGATLVDVAINAGSQWWITRCKFGWVYFLGHRLLSGYEMQTDVLKDVSTFRYNERVCTNGDGPIQQEFIFNS
jgi:hypothetical protein